MQISPQQREKLYGWTAAAGSIMVLAGLASLLVPPARSYFYTASRLGGFFGYANVFALFCLVGIIITAEERGAVIKPLYDMIQILCLMAGIFLSGSRSVMMEMVLVCVILAVRSKRLRKMIVPAMVLLLSGAALYALASGNMQNVGRFLTTSFTSSTLLGRILYIKDALKLLRSHPFGLGYLGYYFLEPLVQTGIYTVRFIHNDVLQIALDIGIFPAALFVGVMLKNICAKEIRFVNRLVVAVIFLHCLIDFDLEFTSVWMLLVLSLDIYKGREINLSTGRHSVFYKWLAGIISVGAVSMGAAMLPYHMGNAALSARLLPFYTEAKVRYLEGLTNPQEARKLAEEYLNYLLTSHFIDNSSHFCYK